MNTNSQLKNFAIGIFVIIAIGILTAVLFYLRPVVGDQGQTIQVRFTNIDKINVGTRVTFAGQPVGEVSAIHEINDARVDTHNGQVYIFQLTLKVDSSIEVYTTDQISIRTAGLLGERSVAITPIPAKPGQPFQRVTARDIMYAEPAGSVEETFAEISRLSNKAEGFIDDLKDAFNIMKKGNMWENLSKSVDNLREITDTINQKEKLQQTLDNLHAFSVDLAHASSKLATIMDTTNDVITDVKEGKGSIGKLLVKDDFYLEVKAILHKAETLMDDINHYGLLFHNDKKWQRVRARRVNLMNQLCSPQEFRNFFNDEVDQVTTSLARVSWVLQEAADECGCEDAVTAPEFQRVFAELLRRVEGLEESLKLYNEQIEELHECR